VQIIFCAARLAPEKGIEFLLEAFKSISAKHTSIRLRIAGDGSVRSALETMAQELGIFSHVDFLGQLPEKQITEELRNSDLFVLPSLAEGLPVSLMEAMATGVPVVATNIGGISELIESGLSGLLVAPTDALALADAILSMIRDRDFRAQLASNGRRKIADQFDIDVETNKLKVMFESN